MKTTIILILLTISIFATQKEYVRDIPKYVVDVPSTAFIDSKNAYYIIGNKKYGTMQKSWGFLNKETAQKYAEKYGGCIVDYETYVKMDDEAVEKYVKEHGIVISKDINTTKPIDTKPIKKSKPTSNRYSNPIKKSNTPVDIFSKENLEKYR